MIDSQLKQVEICCVAARTYADGFVDSLNFREHSSVLADMASLVSHLEAAKALAQKHYTEGGDAA